MKKVIILNPTLVGDTWFEPKPFAQSVSDALADRLCADGNARAFETKVVEVPNTKAGAQKKTGLSSSPAVPASPKKTPRKRKRVTTK